MFRITSAVFAGFLGLWSVSQAAQADGITGEAGAGISYQPKGTPPAPAMKPRPFHTSTWTGATSA